MQRDSLPEKLFTPLPLGIRSALPTIPSLLNTKNGATWLFSALLTTIFIIRLGGSYASLSPISGVLLGAALTFVWLDGIMTEIGQRRGLEESNPVISNLQNIAGNTWGLVISRILMSALVIYTVTFPEPYALPMITAIFTICTANNLTRIVRSKPSWGEHTNQKASGDKLRFP